MRHIIGNFQSNKNHLQTVTGNEERVKLKIKKENGQILTQTS